MGEWELSLDAPVGDGSSEDHKSFLPDKTVSQETALSQLELKGLLTAKLEAFQKGLSPREREIFQKRIADHFTCGKPREAERSRMEKIVIKQGEAKTVTFTVKDASGTGVDLSGAAFCYASATPACGSRTSRRWTWCW